MGPVPAIYCRSDSYLKSHICCYLSQRLSILALLLACGNRRCSMDMPHVRKKGFHERKWGG